MNEVDDVTMLHRRELLRRAAVLLGGSLSAPAVQAVMAGSTAHADPAWRPAFLSDARLAVVAEVADIMIPRTDTPGARDVGVPAFIDTILADVYAAADRERYLTGLAAFEDEVRRQTGTAFLALDGDRRGELVQTVHDAALAAGGPGGVLPHQRPFILMTKELTLLGFFTSQAGATEVLQYQPVPGAYHGCLPLADAGNGRTWATETNLPF